MDAITLLKEDHRSVEKLFKRFEKAGDNAYVEKRDIVDRIIEELSKHAAVEEQLFYPVTRATVPAVEDVALESLEEHHIVKWVLSELDGMDPADERFTAKVTVLIENVRHHVEEEESDYFPKVRDELGRKALADLGEALEAAKAVAPTHPHPRAPDTPPGNFVAGTAAGVVDRVGDTVAGIAQGTTGAVQDVVARVRGSKRPARAQAKGQSAQRKASSAVRGGASEALDDVIDLVERAKATGEETTARAKRAGRSATTGAKRTTKTARSAAKRTTGTAKAAARRTTSTSKAGAKQTSGTARAGAKKAASTAKGAARSTARAASGRAR